MGELFDFKNKMNYAKVCSKVGIFMPYFLKRRPKNRSF